jgi:hypothetical protein
MAKQTAYMPARFIAAVVLQLGVLVFGLPRAARYSTFEAQVWVDFWIALISVISIIVLWPIVRRGRPWPWLGACVLCLFPCLTLFWALADRFDLQSVLRDLVR